MNRFTPSYPGVVPLMTYGKDPLRASQDPSSNGAYEDVRISALEVPLNDKNERLCGKVAAPANGEAPVEHNSGHI